MLAEARQDPLGDEPGFGAGSFRHHDRERGAAVAEAHVDAGADEATDQGGGLAQRLIPPYVSPAVVVLLQPVQVEKAERERAVEPAAALDFSRERGKEPALVE